MEEAIQTLGFFGGLFIGGIIGVLVSVATLMWLDKF